MNKQSMQVLLIKGEEHTQSEAVNDLISDPLRVVRRGGKSCDKTGADRHDYGADVYPLSEEPNLASCETCCHRCHNESKNEGYNHET
jgi:hypothetical protein